MLMRRSIARSTVCCMALAFIVGMTPRVQGESPANDPFPGEWTIYAEPDQDAVDNGQAAFSEAVLFHNGEFSAAVFAMFGFSPAAYSVSHETGTPIFTAVLSSNDRGTLTWMGGETPTGLAGELVWVRADGDAVRYSITGERNGN